MEKQLITISAEEFGLDATEAKQVSLVFTPMIQKMEEIEDEYNQTVRLEPTIENCKKAKELRLRIVKIRTGTADIHKQAKQYYLNGGRFVDGFKNAVTYALQGKETELEKLENHFVNLEKERIEKLQEERIKLISEYVEDYSHLQLGIMEQDVWNAYYEAKKKEFNDKIEAEKKAEQDRIKKEEEERKERERIKVENEKLKAEAEEKEKLLQAERVEALKKQKELEEKARIEAEEKEKLLQAERVEALKKQKELEEKARIEAEAREKLENENKAREEKLKQEQEANDRLKKEDNYKKFLSDNEGNFDKIFKEEGKIVLYKKVAEFII